MAESVPQPVSGSWEPGRERLAAPYLGFLPMGMM